LSLIVTIPFDYIYTSVQRCTIDACDSYENSLVCPRMSRWYQTA